LVNRFDQMQSSSEGVLVPMALPMRRGFQTLPDDPPFKQGRTSIIRRSIHENYKKSDALDYYPLCVSTV